MAFTLRARFVFPVSGPAIENGAVTVEGERIAAVERFADSDASTVIDLGDVALLPGLVNCHTHLEFSELSRPLGLAGIPFVDWIRLVINQRGHGHANEAGAISKGFSESRRCGVTTIGDIIQRFAESPNGSLAEASTFTLFLEVIGFSRARAESAYAAALERLDTLTRRVRAKIGISPHAPYSVSPTLFKRLVEIGAQRGLTVATHLAESEEELRFLDSGAGAFRELLEERSMWDAEVIPRGGRPMDYLRMLAEAPRALVVHGNYLDESEQDFLAAQRERMSIVFCPRTHAYFGHSRYPLPELLRKGVRVALGTDSRASNPDLDLFAEMRHVARSFPELDPQHVLRMGTVDGAEALGRSDGVGSIEPGKIADLVAMPLAADIAASGDDVLSSLLEHQARPTAVWSRGARLVEPTATGNA